MTAGKHLADLSANTGPLSPASANDVLHVCWSPGPKVNAACFWRLAQENTLLGEAATLSMCCQKPAHPSSPSSQTRSWWSGRSSSGLSVLDTRSQSVLGAAVAISAAGPSLAEAVILRDGAQTLRGSPWGDGEPCLFSAPWFLDAYGPPQGQVCHGLVVHPSQTLILKSAVTCNPLQIFGDSARAPLSVPTARAGIG